MSVGMGVKPGLNRFCCIGFGVLGYVKDNGETRGDNLEQSQFKTTKC